MEGPRLTLDEGTALLCRTLEEHRDTGAGEIADALMDCARATRHEDDRAVLVVRRLRGPHSG